mmetsp:Transcript_20562/g.52321  ORF Transcript_20562/g.52321 Transcript_20562/m.52321 type:complete len:275 (-) Transcript_20562:397-1221(-)
MQISRAGNSLSASDDLELLVPPAKRLLVLVEHLPIAVNELLVVLVDHLLRGRLDLWTDDWIAARDEYRGAARGAEGPKEAPEAEDERNVERDRESFEDAEWVDDDAPQLRVSKGVNRHDRRASAERYLDDALALPDPRLLDWPRLEHTGNPIEYHTHALLLDAERVLNRLCLCWQVAYCTQARADEGQLEYERSCSPAREAIGEQLAPERVSCDAKGCEAVWNHRKEQWRFGECRVVERVRPEHPEREVELRVTLGVGVLESLHGLPQLGAGEQ